MNTMPESRYPAVEATIEQIRYWVPTIADVARTVEARDEGSWLLSIEPHLATACPVAIALRQDGRFDISLAGETYEDRVFQSLDQLVVLLESIVDGQVIQRRWISAVTGVPQGVETLVQLGAIGLLWRNGAEPDGGVQRHDRHFLPYRRQP
ncbi:hypothetical protein [Hyphomicrobium sp.]|uniref:hypothetical protein n=1 Tax=Hyphomicrobium sp. TaxID=82 RepID=UPI0025BE89C9|nr:hypothetical protein [Hyphomicrobium sp.]MCC7252025.1 hypothetical protein [Hyphomicrobium sp.]